MLQPVRHLATYPYGDDTFYLFSIARHVAMGQGPTVDGIHVTSGFQPLIVLLYTPIFWICTPNSWLAVRWTFILSGAIAALFVWAIALLVRTLERSPNPSSFSAPVIAAAIWTFSYPCFLQMTNGLETGLVSLLLVIAIILYSNDFTTTRTREERSQVERFKPWLLGIVLGFAVLARIDTAIFVAIVVLLLLWRRKLRDAIIVGVVAFVVSLPWWLFNWIYFGSLMPESGQAENVWPLPPHENIFRAVQSISDILTLVVYLSDSISFQLRLWWLIILLAGVCFFGVSLKLFTYAKQEFRSSALLPLLLFSFALILYYTFFFRAPHFMARYFQPTRILWSVFFAAGVALIWKRKRLRSLVLLIIVATLSLFAARIISGSFGPIQADLYETGVWASQHPNDNIGMLQSGVASFVAPNVINLDGKVNDDALRAHQQGRLGKYLLDQQFTYIADEKSFIEDVAQMARNNEPAFDSIGMIGQVEIMKRRDP